VEQFIDHYNSIASPGIRQFRFSILQLKIENGRIGA